MNLEESARRVHNIGCSHSSSHQVTNHNSRQFGDNARPSGHRSEPCEIETEIEELFKKDKDVCIVCGYVSANEFFSFPSDVETRQQWVTFCDLPLDEIKPHFRLCDRHFKPDDYRISIQRKLLIQTSSVPTLQPKLKHGFGPSTNNSLQSSLNSINIFKPTLNENTSQNSIYSPVVQGNLRSEVLRLRTRCSLLEDTVAELKKRIEQLDEKCFVAVVESVEKVADEDGYSTDSSMPPLEISSDELHTSEEPFEKFSEEGGSNVYLNVLGDYDEIASGISVSPQISHHLSKNDTSANLNNEQFDKAYVGQTLRMEQVPVTTQQQKCGNELNACQRNGQASSPAGCSKRRKSGGERRITRLAKKKELPSVATTIQTSGSFSKKVRGVLIRDSPPPCCNICDETFSDKSDWRTHQRKHSKRFQCPKCGKQFAFKSYLIRHQATHSDEKPYKCGICDKRFKTNRGKRLHELVHAEGASFECAVCGKMLQHRSSIIPHLNIHSGRKPFRCQTCGTRFAQKHHLVYHNRTHCKEKKFKCRICNKLFKHHWYKIEHERLHKEASRFECALCGKKYRNKSGLVYHISHNL